MNWDIVQGKWQQLKGTAQEKWGELTNDDLDQIDGKKDQLAGKLQEKYGWTKEQAEQEIDNYFADKV
ncbi:CsbD family protein [Paracoccus sp. Z330]|uniref:CsbD family protein n=1 Tax=Paracoccus onchidii TaxID=3017813 RepID=A0ABT4ZGY5_9RHOB|nr:CsbD family protein [Paracoccus onchidii]MDB6178629.1 CsbD family protein [Paracoccus onchidii]